MPPLPLSTESQTKDRSREELALKNILNSQTFSDMPRLKRFLEYVVTETIEGRSDRLKGVVIACDVFDKNDPDEAQSTTIVRVEAGRLRRRLNDYYQSEGKKEALKITIPKGGYVVVFEAAAKNLAKTGDQQVNAESGEKWFTIRKSMLALALLISLVATFLFWDNYIGGTKKQTPDQTSALAASKPLIAVLPFRNIVRDDPDDSIAYGLTEDIITDLGGLPTLEVISMTSVLPFEDLDINLIDISAKLGVQYVLSGSVRGTTPDLRVTAQLYDAVNGVQLWAERFDRQMTSELDLQDEIAHRVVDSLSLHLQGRSYQFINQRQNTDTETWSLYKQAMNLASPPSDPAMLELSLQTFNEVIQHDPNFAGGYAGAAYVHAFKAFFGHSESNAFDVRKAMEMAEMGKSIDPSFGLSYIAQAFSFLVNRDYEQALRASAKAVEFSPNDPYVMAYNGFILCASGNADEAITYVETALRLDPLNARTPYLNILGVINFQAGHYETALQAFLKNQERGGPIGPGIHYFVTAAYVALGDSTKAADSLGVADLLRDENNDWEDWVRRSWKNQKDSDHILKLIEQIRESRS